MLKPTIHSNGTSREELLNQVLEAGHKIRDAIKALAAAAPNGRDYYPQGTSAIQEAIEEYRARARKLEEVFNDLQTLAEHIADA